VNGFLLGADFSVQASVRSRDFARERNLYQMARHRGRRNPPHSYILRVGSNLSSIMDGKVASIMRDEASSGTFG
jgi:hypothetical protein